MGSVIFVGDSQNRVGACTTEFSHFLITHFLGGNVSTAVGKIRVCEGGGNTPQRKNNTNWGVLQNIEGREFLLEGPKNEPKSTK